MSINGCSPTDSNQLRDILLILEVDNQKIWVKLATLIAHNQIFIKDFFLLKIFNFLSIANLFIIKIFYFCSSRSLSVIEKFSFLFY